MAKFQAVGTHGQVDPARGREVAPHSLAWLTDRLADGTLDAAFSMAGGGRLLIANAASEEELRATLAAAPDVDRTWTITALTDAIDSIKTYLAATPGS
jgi:hypothetical protein